MIQMEDIGDFIVNLFKGVGKPKFALTVSKPVFFSGIRIQNRGQWDEEGEVSVCKKFNVYCSMDGKKILTK